MKYKIILDSMSNLVQGDKLADDVDLDVVPLTLRLNDVDYVDDGHNDLSEIIPMVLKDKKLESSTSCPSPQAFLDCMKGADKYIIITLSQRVSGSYNSACLAKTMAEDPSSVFVLDSMSDCGVIELIARKAIDLIHEGKSFEEICDTIEKYREEVNILFIVDRYDTLIRKGRVNKLVASIASILKIKPLGIAKGGEIRIQEKVRTLEGTVKRLIVNIEKFCADTKDKICVISHTLNPEKAKMVKDMIKEKYQFKEIIIRDNSLVNSYYGLTGCVMVSF